MTQDNQFILGNTLSQACTQMNLKAAILICFEEGTRTIIPIGRNLDLCLSAEKLATELQAEWQNQTEAAAHKCDIAADPAYRMPLIPDNLN